MTLSLSLSVNIHVVLENEIFVTTLMVYMYILMKKEGDSITCNGTLLRRGNFGDLLASLACVYLRAFLDIHKTQRVYLLVNVLVAFRKLAAASDVKIHFFCACSMRMKISLLSKTNTHKKYRYISIIISKNSSTHRSDALGIV